MIDDSYIWMPLQKKLSKMSIQQRQQWANNLTPEDQLIVVRYPEVFLADYQLPPVGDWFYYWARFGRGCGKTLTAILWALQKSRQGAEEIDYFAPTYTDLKKEVYPVFLKYLIDPIVKSDFSAGIVETKNTIYKFYTSETEPRGMNADYMVWDEIPKWCGGNNEQISYITSLAKLGMRGKKASPHPQLMIASTPKPFDVFINHEEKVVNKHPYYAMRIVSTREAVFLPPAAKAAILEEFTNHPLERQELDADLLTETPGAYWTHDQLRNCHQATPIPVNPGAIRYGSPQAQKLTNAQLMGQAPIEKMDPNMPYLLRIVIGFDPSGSSDGDECGILVVALFSNHRAYVLEDCSGSYNPQEYAKLIDEKYRAYQASAVVVESNFGGKASFDYILRSVNATMRIIPIHSKQGKTTRAEHISALYAQGKVYHQTLFKQLEDQMCKFNVHYSKSPDRLDALGFALTELFWPTDASGNQIYINNIPRLR